MPEVRKRVVKIFAHAQALQQNGRLRNTVYCLKKAVFILNQDHTVLIRFPLREGETPFTKPVSFRANDYDSSQFTEKDGRVVFTTTEGEYVREKSCKTPQMTPKDVKNLFKSFCAKWEKAVEVQLSADFIKQLDENLSHIEFSGKDGVIVAKQRDIYSGSVITITKKDKKSGLFGKILKKVHNFKPIGIRTNDFLSLFTFVDQVTFYFGTENNLLWFSSTDPTMKFDGVIGTCKYDEMGGDDGRG